MIPMTLAEIGAVVGGTVHGDAATEVTGAAYVDTRTPQPGGLFVAVVGEHVDGHDYAAGAHAVLGSRPTEAPTVVVDDPVAALGRLSRHVVDTSGAAVVALTGSQGKTGTKDYLAHVLAGDAPTVATRGNFNNELGVPLTVLETTTDTRHLVVEMGARGVGHVGYLCTLAPPRVAAVLNVGTAHLAEFGSRELIAQAKGEIVEALPADGVAALNADDPLVAAMAPRTRARVITFGEAGDVSWRGLVLDARGHPSFELGYAGEWHPVSLALSGRHQVANAAAAAAMAIGAGLALGDVAERLSTAQSASRWRMEVTERADGVTVVNDAYNANPDSMRAALRALSEMDVEGRRVAVLGGMLELGETAPELHRQTGRAAADLGIDVLVGIGDLARDIVDGFGEGETRWAADTDAAHELLTDLLEPGDVVLLKSSRDAGLRWLGDRLAGTGEAADR